MHGSSISPTALDLANHDSSPDHPQSPLLTIWLLHFQTRKHQPDFSDVMGTPARVSD